MESQEGQQIAAALAHRVGKTADAAQPTDAIVSVWQEIDDALSPILGKRGVAALYRRSLHLTSPAYPWLAGPHESIQTAIDLAALKIVFAQQSGANATAGAGALLQTFHELLATLVGPSLTERLLRSVWANSLSGPPAQDTTP